MRCSIFIGSNLVYDPYVQINIGNALFCVNIGDKMSYCRFDINFKWFRYDEVEVRL